MTQNTVGVDVSKDQLDAHRLADGGAKPQVSPQVSPASRRWPDNQDSGPAARESAPGAPICAACAEIVLT